MSHGYTSHKASILNWATRLADEGVPTLLFDQPGHYLGSFNEVKSFKEYKEQSHKLYGQAYNLLSEIFCESYPLYEHYLGDQNLNIVLAGHSLSALLAIKALDEKCFVNKKTTAICVGLGLNQSAKTHIFQTPFYKSTLNIREQLVSPELSPKNVFPWIGEEKKNLNIKNKRIHFITGEDDIVVGAQGTESIIDAIKDHNEVSFLKPPSLPHHQPELAAPHIKQFLKQNNLI